MRAPSSTDKHTRTWIGFSDLCVQRTLTQINRLQGHSAPNNCNKYQTIKLVDKLLSSDRSLTSPSAIKGPPLSPPISADLSCPVLSRQIPHSPRHTDRDEGGPGLPPPRRSTLPVPRPGTQTVHRPAPVPGKVT